MTRVRTVSEVRAMSESTAPADKSPRGRPKVALPMTDGRSKERVRLRTYRKELVAHVGGRPSATQSAIIEQAIQIRLRLGVMDDKFAASGAMTEHDSRSYLAWANSYTRLMRQLGLAPAKAPAPTLSDYIGARAA